MAKRLPAQPLAPIPNELAQPMAPTETVQMQSPSGEVQQVEAGQAATLAALGYKQVTQELTAAQAEHAKYGEGIVNELEAAGLGILRGSTLGLSDLALRKLNPQWADSAAKLKEYNPDASLAGELGSFALPLAGSVKALGAAGKAAKGAGLLQDLVGGGGEALGKIAEKIVGENLAGTVAKGAVNAAAQSAVYQAAHNISEASLADKDLTAESIFANTGHAAILGAGLGAAVPIIARGAQEVAQSAPVRYALSGAAKQFAKFFDPNRSLQLFTGAAKKELNAETGQRFQTAVDELAHDHGASFYSAGEVALDPATAKLVKIADGGAPTQEEAFARLESLQKQTGNTMGETLKAADTAAAQAGFETAATKFGYDEAKLFGDKINKWSSNGQITDAEAQRLQNIYNDLVPKINDKSSLQALHEMRKALDARVGGKNWDKLGGEEVELIKDLRRSVSSKLDDGLQELADNKLVPADTLERWKRLNRLASNLYTIEKPLSGAIARSEANVNVMGLRFRDIGIGAIGAGVLGPAGAALGIANKALQTDRGLLLRAQIGEKIQKLAWAEQLTDKSTSQIASSIKGFLGKGSAERIANEVTGRTSAPIAYAMSERADPGPRMEKQHDWFDDTRKQILAVASNPEAFASHQGSQIQGMADVAPALSDALVNKQLQVYAYLANVMPKNPSMPLSVINDKWKPADYEVQGFRKVVQVARAPLTILDDMRSGSVTKAQVDAVRQLYPKIYERVLLEVQHQINQPDTEVTYNQRLRLGQLFPGADPRMAPQFIAAMQAPQGKPQPSTPHVSSRKPGFSSRRQTATDRNESGQE